MEEEENFIRSNTFEEMLAELAQVKAKEDLDMTAEDFLRYLTETGKCIFIRSLKVTPRVDLLPLVEFLSRDCIIFSSFSRSSAAH